MVDKGVCLGLANIAVLLNASHIGIEVERVFSLTGLHLMYDVLTKKLPLGFLL